MNNPQFVNIKGRKYEYVGYEIDPIIGNPGTIHPGAFHLFVSTEGYSPIMLSSEDIGKLPFPGINISFFPKA